MSYITLEELNNLRNAKDEAEWDSVCDAIKAAHNGYPIDWWGRVMSSGLAAEVAAKWGKPDAFELKVETINDVSKL